MHEITERRFQLWNNTRNRETEHNPLDDQRWTEAVITAFMQGDNLNIRDFRRLFCESLSNDEIRNIARRYYNTVRQIKKIGSRNWWNRYLTLD